MDDLDDDDGEDLYDYYTGARAMDNIYAKIKGNDPANAKPKEPRTQEEIDMQKNIFLARNNSIKNSMLKSSSPNIFIGKKKNKGLLADENNKKAQHSLLKNNSSNSKNQKNNKKVNFSFGT